MAAALPPVFTVAQGLQQCGIPNAPAFGGQTPPQHVASQIFMDSFDTTLSITTEEVSDAITAFTKLTVTNGRISMQPGVKRRILASFQWTRSMLRTGRDLTLIAFPVGDILTLTSDLKTCKQFEERLKLMATQSKPKKLHT